MQRIHDCLSQLPVYITFFDRAGRIVWSSVYAYGVTADALAGQASDTLIVEADRVLWWAAFYRARDGRSVSPYTVRVAVPEPPHEVRLAGWLSPVLLDGAVSHVVCVCRDVAIDPPAAPAAHGTPPGVPHGALWLSPLGQKVVNHLATRGRAWTTAEALADATGETNGHRFRAALTGLVDRRILEASSGSGYRLRT